MGQFDAHEAVRGRFSEAVGLGIEAEIAFLQETLQQAVAEGTGEDVWVISWYLVNAFARNGQGQEAVATAERLLAQPGASPQIGTYIAETLHRDLGRTAAALAFVQKCRADLEATGTLWEFEYYAGDLISLELALLALEDPYAKRIRMAASELHWHSINKPSLNDHLLEAFRLLAPLGVLNRIHKPLLEIMWAQLQRRMKFDRMTKPHRRDLQAKIEEVERLIAALQVRRSHPKPPKDATK